MFHQYAHIVGRRLLASSQPGRQMVLHAESPPVVHAAQVEHLHEGAAGPHDDAGLILFFLDKTPHSRHMGILHHVQLPDPEQTPLTTFPVLSNI
jgi:hypothetical protein